MGRIFALTSAIAVLMIVLAGGGIYWLSTAEMHKTRESAAESVAKGVAFGIAAQTQVLAKSINKIVRNPVVITAIDRGDPDLLKKIEAQIAGFLPDVMRVWLFLPGTIVPDDSTVPNLGYADIELVQKTFKKNQYPVIQGKKGPNRHMAIARGIVKDGRVIGVLLASLDYRFLSNTFRRAGIDNDYLELKQDRLIMGSAGNPKIKEAGKSSQVNIPGTQWKIQYWVPANVSLGSFSLYVSAIIVPVLLACLGFFIGYRRLSGILRTDQSSILKVIKDSMTGQLQGNYPIILDEMKAVVSTALQFKRVLDEGDFDPASISSSDGLDVDDFFTELDTDTGLNVDRVFAEINDSELAIEEKTTDKEVEGNEENSLSLPVSMSDSDVSEQPLAAPFSSQNMDFQSHDEQATIFRAYDIRGIVGSTLTRDMVSNIGRALGSEAKEQGCNRVIIGRDGRNSSPELSEALAQGVLMTGCDVTDIGMVPTPVLYFVVQHSDGRTGFMITGSHNPAQYNGVKMVVNGETLAEEKIQALRERVENQHFVTEEKGSLENNDKVVNEYIGTITEDVHIGRPMKVVVDCGNGVAGELAPILLKTLGCEVIELFCDIDGDFPNHHPDPSQPENLADLIAAVQHYDADIGFAFDGDGDRLGVVDSKGKIIWPDRQMMLFAKDVLSRSPGAEIIFDVKCSRHLQEQIEKFGGRPVMWKTGHSLMKAKLKETTAKLAGEMSGHIYFNDRWFGFDDALYSACRMVEILSSDSRGSDEVFAEFPDSINTPELNIELAEGENVTYMDEMIKTADFTGGKITTIDGIRVDFADGWGLVRASNTTPALVLRFEADNQEALERIQNQFRQLMKRIKPDISLPF